MYLFIFESIGTSELILVGVVALIFLGPRRLPEIARKAGKMMADLRSTTDEFKETWKREVDIEKELKTLRIDDLEDETVSRIKEPSPPAVGEVDAEEFHRRLSAAPNLEAAPEPDAAPSAADLRPSGSDDKRNWL